jgi:UDP-N-acetylmuramoyl-tripeptide--D-alanyl-D-alanine ligase
MKTLTLEETVRAVRGRITAQPTAATVSGVSTDSRTAAPGQLFFALRGANFDGHDFVREALRRGAAGAVVALDTMGKLNLARDVQGLIWVDEPRRALGRLATYHRRQLAATVIAVTGSNGKTTVKRMIDHVLGETRHGTSSPKSYNNDIGVPLTLLSADGTHDYVVVEIGTNAPGEVRTLGRIAEPNLAVITNVGESHLEKLVSVDGVAEEKASLLGCVRSGGHAAVNADDPALLRRLSRDPSIRVTRFGTIANADLRASDIELGPASSRFRVNDRFEFELSVPGRHNVMNALATIAAARGVGLAHDEIAGRLQSFRLPEMRLEVESIGRIELIFDAYNANPPSMAAALDVFARCEHAGRRVLVLGDMNELGAESERLHRRLGESLDGTHAAALVAVGRWAETVAAAAPEGTRTHVFADTEKAASGLPKLLRAGDLVLMKASRGLHFEKLREAVRARFAKRRTVEAGAR